MVIIKKIKKVNGWIMLKTRYYVLVFCCARYSKAMVEITVFSMKDCLILPGLGWKYFNSLRTEEDEPIYTYNDNYTR